MKKLHHIFFAVIAFVCMTAVQSCSDDKAETKHQVSVDNSEIDLAVTQEQQKFTITSKVTWNITAEGLNGTDGGWYTLSAASGSGKTEITVDAKANNTGLQRTATLTVNGKYNEVPVTITQDTDLSHTFGEKFLAWCLDSSKGNVDANGDGLISKAEAEAITKIECGNQSLESLKGIENFTKLTVLNCYTNQLSALDVIKNTALTFLNCYNNQLSALDLSKNTELIDLSCGTNKLPALDVSNNTALTVLDCGINQLPLLDVINNTALGTLYCNDNKLSALDVSNNTKLILLNCGGNLLTVLDVSNNTALEYLSCHTSQLPSLDVSKNTKLLSLSCKNNPNLATLDISGSSFVKLKYFDCTDIQAGATVFVWSGFKIAENPNVSTWKYPADITWTDLTDLNHTFGSKFLAWCLDSSKGNVDANGDGLISKAEAEAITKIECGDQSLESLKGIENFTKLTLLNCYNNQLPALDVSNNTELIDLSCAANQLTSLDVSKNTELIDLSCHTNQLSALDVINNTKLTRLYCYSNQLPTLDVSKNTELIWLWCHINPNLASINISGSSFGKLENFHCTNIKAGATVTVWSGFNINDKPVASNWFYPGDITWTLPTP